MPQWRDAWTRKAKGLKVETTAILLAYKDPRVSWYAKAFAACVVGYAFSPIDLIPDFIPILGQLDDLLLIPVGVALAVRMIPPEVLAECRERAREAVGKKEPVLRMGAVVIVTMWLILAFLAAWLILRARAR